MSGIWTHVVVHVVALTFFLLMAWLLQVGSEPGASHSLTDFNDYHVVGHMVNDGRAAQAYDWQALQAAQVAETGSWAFMPWAYPPPFTLLTGLLGLLPLWLAYVLFIGATWLLFYTALVRLAGRAAVPSLIIVLPAVVINAKCGQNGFLSAGLIGWLLVCLRRRSASAGWPLGLMIFKPHLAAGVALLTVIERQWRGILRAALLALSLCLASTLIFGAGVWLSFQRGTRFAGEYLWNGTFPLERMTSVFAALHRFGLSPGSAMAIHVGVAAVAACYLTIKARRGADRDRVAALAVCVSLMISPYNYDYDMPALALAFGLILPQLVSRATIVEALLLVALTWIATSNYLWIGLRQMHYAVPKIEPGMHLWTISPIALATLFIVAAAILKRPVRQDGALLRSSWNLLPES